MTPTNSGTETKIPSWKDTIPFKPNIKECYVIKVYDGDTITVASKLPYSQSPIYRWSVRIRGIDSPEMKSENKNEVVIAKLAQKTLSNLILNKKVTLENISKDAYGRLLCDVYYNNIIISEWMIKKKLAVPYFYKDDKYYIFDWITLISSIFIFISIITIVILSIIQKNTPVLIASISITVIYMINMILDYNN